MNCAIISYPLSADFRSRFEHSIGESPEYLELAESAPWARQACCGKCGSCAKQLFLLLEDEASEALLPLLQVLASWQPRKSLEIVRSDLKREQFSRWRVFTAAPTLAYASLAGMWQVKATERDCNRLLAQTRGNFVAALDRVLYLKTTALVWSEGRRLNRSYCWRREWTVCVWQGGWTSSVRIRQ